MLRIAEQLLLPLAVAACVTAGGVSPAAAQDAADRPPPLPSVSVDFTLFPYRTLRSVDTDERVGEVRIMTQQASVAYPIVANEGRTSLQLSVAYQRMQFDYRDLAHPLQSVHEVNITAFLRQRLGERWGLILVAAPGYADDLEGPASLYAVSSTLVAAGSYRFNDDFELGFGAAIQDAFGEPLPLPVAAVDWRISDRLWLQSILPVNAELTWLPVDALGLRASLHVRGSNYHGAEGIYGVRNPQLNYSAGTAELGARWYILPFLHLTAHGGYTVFRRFEFSDGREPVPGGEYELRNGMVYGIALGVGG
jgi:hypothetical protein